MNKEQYLEDAGWTKTRNTVTGVWEWVGGPWGNWHCSLSMAYQLQRGWDSAGAEVANSAARRKVVA